jgi:hypothetical protein
MENELKITEVEVTKLNLLPGQVLVVKVYVDDTSETDLSGLKRQLSTLFPNNKIMLFGLPVGGKIEMDVLDARSPLDIPTQAVSPCSEPTAYCNSCSCGKKELIESRKK